MTVISSLVNASAINSHPDIRSNKPNKFYRFEFAIGVVAPAPEAIAITGSLFSQF
ncbi:MAG: hypothetical protein F6K36_26375 [Symploca sp. SIO3C6]|nr:hypothetical protein [Symploca sp. SIO3C6]